MAEHPPCTILIVGHGPSCVVTLVGLLHRQGYTVVTVGNSALAWVQLPVRQYAVILCDLDIPEIDGYTFYALLQQHYPSLCPRVIFLTNDTTEVPGAAFPQWGGHPWLSKTCGVTEVLCAIAQVLHTIDKPHAAWDIRG